MQKVQARHAHHGQCWCAAEAAHQAAHARGDAVGQRPLASTRAEVMVIDFLDTVIFYRLCKLLLNLSTLEMFNLILDLRAHPTVLWILPIDHVMLFLFSFPCTGQHVAAHTAFEVA